MCDHFVFEHLDKLHHNALKGGFESEHLKFKASTAVYRYYNINLSINQITHRLYVGSTLEVLSPMEVHSLKSPKL